MLITLIGSELRKHEPLAQSMFKDRARQFKERLKWQVEVDEGGCEKDQYDLPHTLYVIAQDADGLHAGSMRFLPTTSNTMISDHFQHLAADIDFADPLVWECTRFCIAENALAGTTTLELLAAGAKLLLDHKLLGFVGVFNPLMERVYRRNGILPRMLGQTIEANGQIVKMGFWDNDDDVRSDLLRRIEDLKQPKCCERLCKKRRKRSR